MKSKKEYIILIAVAVVLVLYLIFHQADRSLYQLPEVTDLSGTEIRKVEINTPDETIKLEKKTGKWVITPQGVPAAAPQIDKIMDIVKNFKLTAMVSESENYSRYRLTEDEKITVKAWADGELARAFDIGKAAPSQRHTFVKLPNDPNVYHARHNFRNRFDQTRDALRDKTVLAVDADVTHAIEIKQADKQVKIARTRAEPEVTVSPDEDEAKEPEKPAETSPEQLVWQDARGNEVEESDVADLLNSLSDLKCEQFIDDRQKSDFSDPIYTIKVSGPETHTLSIFNKQSADAKTYPAVSSGSDYPFHLSDQKAKTLMQAIEKE